MSKTDEKVSEVAAKPKEPSAKRYNDKGNPHPIKPEDRDPGTAGNLRATDDLAGALAAKKSAEDNIERIKEAQKNQKEDPLYERDQKIYEMSKGGRLPGQNVGQATTENEASRAEAELKELEAFEDRIKKGEKLNEADTKRHGEVTLI